MDEFSLIDRLLKPLAGPESLGLADDAAVFAAPLGRQLVVTTDMLHAEVHFFADDSPDSIARKALRVNLSDLAAMGADPLCYFLSLGLPRDMTDGWLETFVRALRNDQERFGIRLAGGDTTVAKGPLTLSVTAVGTVPAGEAITRSGAQAGDDLWVSGTIGDAAVGLAVRHATHITRAWRTEAVDRYLLPQPRLSVGTRLRGVATAALDISDGLAQGLGHLCRASGVGADAYLAQLPLSAAVRAAFEDDDANWPLVASGGDDYELLFTAPRRHESQIRRIAEETGVALTRIGRIGKGANVLLLDPDGLPLPLESTGYRHRTGG